jgi:pyruvate dehydrogenase E1 component
LYEPEDSGSILSYRESRNGQLLEEGITEAGALSSWVAAATSYSVHGEPMLAVYIYYSMFGFQRVGDLIWAAADQRSRGILLGATAGRTTLGGEGLQHQDGSSLVMASMVPNCRAWDPCFAGELAVILDHAARRLLEEQCDEFHYVAVMNENYPQPSIDEARHSDILHGLYRYSSSTTEASRIRLRLVGSGAILREVIEASAILARDWNINSEVFSATSFSELARQAREVERDNRLQVCARRSTQLDKYLGGTQPIIAASDYIRAWPQLIAQYLEAPYTTLGTDGFGRSDNRQNLRQFFEVDQHSIVIAGLKSLVDHDGLDPGVLADAIQRYKPAPSRAAPWDR